MFAVFALDNCNNKTAHRQIQKMFAQIMINDTNRALELASSSTDEVQDDFRRKWQSGKAVRRVGHSTHALNQPITWQMPHCSCWLLITAKSSLATDAATPTLFQVQVLLSATVELINCPPIKCC